MIPKRLFFVWFGNRIPKYAEFSLESFRKVNPDFEIVGVFRSVREIEEISAADLDSISRYDAAIRTCIDALLGQNGFYEEYIRNQRNVYGRNLRFVQILSDLVRMELLNEFGGIYLDCDTFPVKPFDESLLETGRFCVSRHYEGNNVFPDNYFMGSEPSPSLGRWAFPLRNENGVKYILQTVPNWRSSLGFVKNRILFRCLSLKIGEWSFSPDFYIDHFNGFSWSSENVSSIPFCKLDKLLVEKPKKP
jgi:mannosyltransferase OCH1-like enzyme